MDNKLKIKRIVAGAVLSLAAVLPASAEMGRRLSLSLQPGSLISLHGAYSSTATLRDTVIPGAGLGLVLGYHIGPHLRLDAGYGYNWLFFKAAQRPSGYKDEKPALVLPLYALNGTIVMGSGKGLQPFFTFGLGIAPWRVGSQAFGGSYLKAPENSDETFSKTSLALNGGMGIEFGIWSRLSASAEAGYLFVFANDGAKFGANGFGRQGFLSLRCGLVFHFGSAEPAAEEEDEEQ